MARNKSLATPAGDDKYVMGPYLLNSRAMLALFDPKADVEVLTSSKTLAISDMNRTYVINAAAGLTITLPTITAQDVGLWIRTEIMTSISSVNFGIDTDGTDYFHGHVFISSATDYVLEQKYFASGATNTHMDMDSTTDGGLIGGKLFIQANSLGSWTVLGTLHGSGTLATPFS